MCGRLFIRILVWLEQQYYSRYDQNVVFRQENESKAEYDDNL